MTKTEREKLIAKHMDVLKCSRAEAEEMVDEDLRIDRMTMTELKAEMGEEHWKVIKEMTKTGERKAPTVYKFDKKKRKSDDSKSEIVQALVSGLIDGGKVDDNSLHIENPEREFTFTCEGRKYKVVLSCPRS